MLRHIRRQGLHPLRSAYSLFSCLAVHLNARDILATIYYAQHRHILMKTHVYHLARHIYMTP